MPEDRLGGDPKAAKPSETTADNRGRKYGHVTHTDYFAQQAAIQSFVAAGLLVGVVAQQVGAEKAREIQRQAAEAADGLFGQVRGRPPAIGEAAPGDDPRILALFEAFGAA